MVDLVFKVQWDEILWIGIREWKIVYHIQVENVSIW